MQLSKINVYEKKLNTFVQIDRKKAQKLSIKPSERYRCGQQLPSIDGIPMALKDNINIKGYETKNGTPLSFPFFLNLLHP